MAFTVTFIKKFVLGVDWPHYQNFRLALKFVTDYIVLVIVWKWIKQEITIPGRFADKYFRKILSE
jgi:hypothetical protein